MTKLDIPFIQQNHSNSCGAAALEAIYKYYGIDIDQMSIFDKYKKQNPASTDDYYIETADLIKDAKQRGFERARWEQLQLDSKTKIINTISEFVNKGIPIIACQQFTKKLSHIGHFRIIVEVTSDYVYFHDPHPEYGGENIKWSVEKFISFWQCTGNNVTGGVLLIIER